MGLRQKARPAGCQWQHASADGLKAQAARPMQRLRKKYPRDAPAWLARMRLPGAGRRIPERFGVPGK